MHCARRCRAGPASLHKGVMVLYIAYMTSNGKTYSHVLGTKNLDLLYKHKSLYLICFSLLMTRLKDTDFTTSVFYGNFKRSCRNRILLHIRLTGWDRETYWVVFYSDTCQNTKCITFDFVLYRTWMPLVKKQLLLNQICSVCHAFIYVYEYKRSNWKSQGYECIFWNAIN